MHKLKKMGLVTGAALATTAMFSPVQAQTVIGVPDSITAVEHGDLKDRPPSKSDRLGPDPGTWKFVSVASGTVIATGFWLRAGPSASAAGLRAMPEGARVEAKLGHAEGDTIWWYVNWIDKLGGGISGWINAEAVDIDLPMQG